MTLLINEQETIYGCIDLNRYEEPKSKYIENAIYEYYGNMEILETKFILRLSNLKILDKENYNSSLIKDNLITDINVDKIKTMNKNTETNKYLIISYSTFLRCKSILNGEADIIHLERIYQYLNNKNSFLIDQKENFYYINIYNGDENNYNYDNKLLIINCNPPKYLYENDNNKKNSFLLKLFLISRIKINYYFFVMMIPKIAEINLIIILK